MILLQALPDAGTQKRAAGTVYSRCEVECGARRYLRSWRPGFPRIWRASASGDGHIHTRNVLRVLARGFVGEVSSLLLCCTGLRLDTFTPSAAPSAGTAAARASFFLVGLFARAQALPRDEKRDRKTRGARRGAQILAGIALRPVGRDFPDTEICLRREPPHPREALPTSDIDFPGENRIEVYSTIFH